MAGFAELKCPRTSGIRLFIGLSGLMSSIATFFLDSQLAESHCDQAIVTVAVWISVIEMMVDAGFIDGQPRQILFCSTLLCLSNMVAGSIGFAWWYSQMGSTADEAAAKQTWGWYAYTFGIVLMSAQLYHAAVSRLKGLLEQIVLHQDLGYDFTDYLYWHPAAREDRKNHERRMEELDRRRAAFVQTLCDDIEENPRLISGYLQLIANEFHVDPNEERPAWKDRLDLEDWRAYRPVFLKLRALQDGGMIRKEHLMGGDRRSRVRN